MCKYCTICITCIYRQVTNDVTHIFSSSPLKPEEHSGVEVEMLHSHPMTPPDSTDTSQEESQEEREEEEKGCNLGNVTDPRVLRVRKYITHPPLSCSSIGVYLQGAPDLSVMAERAPAAPPMALVTAEVS